VRAFIIKYFKKKISFFHLEQIVQHVLFEGGASVGSPVKKNPTVPSKCTSRQGGPVAVKKSMARQRGLTQVRISERVNSNCWFNCHSSSSWCSGAAG
jgi:hypothetical protein